MLINSFFGDQYRVVGGSFFGGEFFYTETIVDGTDKTTVAAGRSGYAPWSPPTYDKSTKFFPV